MAKRRPSVQYIFVYGTLRSSPSHRMSRVLKRSGEFVGRGEMPGILYDFGTYPGAVTAAKAKSVVRGDVYRLAEPEETLRVLDRYEGFQPLDHRGSEFRRARKLVRLASGNRVRAWVYLYNQPVGARPRIRSGDYFTGTGRASGVSEKRSR